MKNKPKSPKDNPIPLSVKPERPSILGGITVKVATGCGNMYIQMNWYHGRLFEVFATLGHSGGCTSCQMEAITRSATLGLKYGIPISEYIHQFRGIQCPSPLPFPKENKVLSCPDAVATTLDRYGSLPIDKIVELLYSVNGGAESIGDDVTEEQQAISAMKELFKTREDQGLNG